MRPDAVIATWEDEERLRGFELQADGKLLAIERPNRSAMWSPPEQVGELRTSAAGFHQYLADLTGGGS